MLVQECAAAEAHLLPSWAPRFYSSTQTHFLDSQFPYEAESGSVSLSKINKTGLIFLS